MSDIELRLDGDASGATQALNETGKATGDLANETGKAAVKWQLMADVVTKATSAVVKFGADSVKAYAESERIHRQLTRAAGAHTEALSNQAKALSKLYAVDDDIIKQSATLLSQWGGAAAASKDVQVAVLDLAAAMGTDLNSATQALIRNVESGGTGLAKMGIHFKATGEKGHDLAAAVAAINGKLGGAAEADASTLTGQLRSADIAFGDLQKTIGGSISTFLEQSGAIDGMTRSLELMNQVLGGDEEHKRMIALLELRKATLELQEKQRAASGIATSGAPQSLIDFFVAEVDKAQAKVNQLKASIRDVAPVGGSGVEGGTNSGRQAAEQHAKAMSDIIQKNVETMRKEQKDLDLLDEHARERDQESYAAELEMSAKRVDLAIKEGNDTIAALQLQVAKEAEIRRKAEEKKQETVARFFAESNESNIQFMANQADRWAQVGGQIGDAFVNALGSQLEQLANGGEFDVAAFMGDILGAAIGIAASALSIAFPSAAPLIGAVGNLANMGVKYGFAALKGAKAKGPIGSFHEGGWVGDEPRHHDGAWIGADERRAVLQTNERVLSRKEVHHMGGPAAVDNLARGGGPQVAVYLSAIDSKSAADSFASDLADGMRDAQRRGLGALPSLLGADPR